MFLAQQKTIEMSNRWMDISVLIYRMEERLLGWICCSKDAHYYNSLGAASKTTIEASRPPHTAHRAVQRRRVEVTVEA